MSGRIYIKNSEFDHDLQDRIGIHNRVIWMKLYSIPRHRIPVYKNAYVNIFDLNGCEKFHSLLLNNYSTPFDIDLNVELICEIRKRNDELTKLNRYNAVNDIFNKKRNIRNR